MGVTTATTESSAVVTAPPADLRRDAGQLRPELLPRRKTRAASRSRKYQVVFRRSVLNDIRAHGVASPEVEVCGVVVGNVFRDAHGPYCLIEANIRGNYASGRNAQVTFTSETWTHIHQQMEQRFPGRRILGWYHTHPGFGIFLSDMDLFIQEHFFAEPFQIAFVDDPKGGDRGAFVWRKGSAVREPFLVEENAPDQSPLAQGGDSLSIEPSQDTPARTSGPGARRRLLLSAVLISSLALGLGAIALFAWWWRT